MPTLDSLIEQILTLRNLEFLGAYLGVGLVFATIAFDAATRTALLIPSEAVIRTGKRSLVMCASGGTHAIPTYESWMLIGYKGTSWNATLAKMSLSI